MYIIIIKYINFLYDLLSICTWLIKSKKHIYYLIFLKEVIIVVLIIINY